MSASLRSLPDDLILDILKYLDTARDVASFALSSRRARALVTHTGWQDFVRTKFSLRLPASDSSWASLAERLTYLDRCWGMRGLRLTAYAERGNRTAQSVGFQPVMTASQDGEEMETLVIGAGEDVIVKNGGGWARVQGRGMGYDPGNGDVTAVTTVQRGRGAEVLVGRARGEMHILSTDPETLGAQTGEVITEGAGPRRTSPGQAAVSWAEWEPRNRVLASCRGSVLALHAGDGLQPVAQHDAAGSKGPGETCFVRSVKFMTPDLLAAGLGRSRQPLRWARLRPEGVDVLHTAHAGERAEPTTVRAIEAVYGSPNLLLSAWDDGSHRLSDLRTPSAYDALYRDPFEPYQASSSLLVYGSERFVAGSNFGANIRLFDLRLPRAYHHLNALPCSSLPHTPASPFAQTTSGEGGARCEHVLGRRCTRHKLSSDAGWQPDALLHIGGPKLDRVHSLAKASDTSPNFYIGFRGAVVQASLSLGSACAHTAGAPEGWRAGPPRGRVSLMETGVGLCEEDEGVREVAAVPTLYHHIPSQRADWSRLDAAYHRV